MERQIDVIATGVQTLEPKSELIKKLSKGKPLKIKLGADPTAPDLHLGHAVVLGKMRVLQDFGHEIIFLIGDFTSKIGDPTGKSKTRPPLTDEQIQENAKTYFAQVGKILDISKTKIVYNSHWLSKIDLAGMIKIIGKCSLAQIIEREDFKNRMEAGTTIGFHELLYPILQAYDSVHLEADIELGGTDQTFNLQFGRHLQEAFGQEPQVVLTMPILVGLDGKKKMSKSLGNYVGLFEEPQEAFAKLMSLPDSAVEQYFTLLLNYDQKALEDNQRALENGTVHAMTLKKEMAFKVVSKFWSESQAQSAQQQFQSRVQDKDYASVPEVSLLVTGETIWIVDLLKELRVITSSSEAKRLIEGNAVEINGEVIKDFKHLVSTSKKALLVAGKKFAKNINFQK